MSLEKLYVQLLVGKTGLFNLGIATSLGEGKLWIHTYQTPLKNFT